MKSLYAIKRRARLKVHEQFRVPAFYYPSGPSGGYQTIHVREHTDEVVSTGGLPGTDMGYATQYEVEPTLIFDRTEIEPTRSAVVSLRPGVVYVLGAVKSKDGRFTTMQAERQREESAEQFESPMDPYA